MPCATTTLGRSGNLSLSWLRMLFLKSIFSFVSAIAAKCGWEFSSGWCCQQALTCCGILVFSGSLAIWLSATGKPTGSLSDGTPKSCRAIITVPSHRQPVNGCGQEDSESQACKRINGDIWNSEVGTGQQVSLKSELEPLVTRVDVLAVAVEGAERALEWLLWIGVPETPADSSGREIPDGHIWKQPVCSELYCKRYWGQTLLHSTVLAQLLTVPTAQGKPHNS